MVEVSTGNQRSRGGQGGQRKAGSAALRIVEELKSVGRIEALFDREVKTIALELLGVRVRGKELIGGTLEFKREVQRLDDAVDQLLRESPEVATALRVRVAKVSVDNAEEGKALNFLLRRLEPVGSVDDEDVSEETRGGAVVKLAEGAQAIRSPAVLQRRSYVEKKIMPPPGKTPKLGQPVKRSQMVDRSPEKAGVGVDHQSCIPSHSVSGSVSPDVGTQSESGARQAANTSPSVDETRVPIEPNLESILSVLNALRYSNKGYAHHSVEQLVEEASKGMEEAIWAAAELAWRFPRGATRVISSGVLNTVAFSPRPSPMTPRDVVLWARFDALWPAIRALYEHEKPR